MDPEKAKQRFIKNFTPYSKYWWKLTMPGVIFFALGTHFLINRSISWDFVTNSEFYLYFVFSLVFYTLIDYYSMYRPNLKHHLGADSKG